MSTTIEDRFILILKDQLTAIELKIDDPENSPPPTHWDLDSNGQLSRPIRGTWERLEALTGISSQSWRGAFVRRQRPTTAMIGEICKLLPEYAFWLATGITDAANGHVAPSTALTFPERLYHNSSYSSYYFRYSIELNQKLYQEGGIDLSNDKQRMYAVERTNPLGSWIASPLLSTAYKLSGTEDYQHLEKLWKDRERERAKAIGHIEGRDRPWIEKREKEAQAGRVSYPTVGRDPRTAHQDNWDLFFIPQSDDNKSS